MIFICNWRPSRSRFLVTTPDPRHNTLINVEPVRYFSSRSTSLHQSLKPQKTSAKVFARNNLLQKHAVQRSLHVQSMPNNLRARATPQIRRPVSSTRVNMSCSNSPIREQDLTNRVKQSYQGFFLLLWAGADIEAPSSASAPNSFR